MPAPKEALKRAIARWEGLYQGQASDPGNYVQMPDGSRRLIGTMRGVTPAVLAAHRGIPPHAVTEAIVKSVTLEEAAEIGLTRFYKGTGLDLLPWGPATEALVDFGWGSGPGQAAKSLQRLVGVAVDGQIGPITVDAYRQWIVTHGWEIATRLVRDMRVAFYDLIIQRNPALAIYRQGWRNRANWMTPETPEWWADWAAKPAPIPAAADLYAGELPKPTEPAPVMPPRTEASGDAFMGKMVTGAGAISQVAETVHKIVMGVSWQQILATAVAAAVCIAGFVVFQRMQSKHKTETQVGT